MTEQPPSGSSPSPGEYPSSSEGQSAPGNHPPPPGNYPPPPPGNFPPPPPGQGYAPGGTVDLSDIGPVQVATIWLRLAARLIDSVLYVIVYLLLKFVGVAELVSSEHTVTDAYGRTVTEPSQAGVLGYFLVLLAAITFGLLYEWLMVGLVGATLGKYALGVKVVNQSSGRVIGLGQSFVRGIIPFLGGLFCYVGALLIYLSPLFDSSGRLQGWHDKAANDLVIKAR